MHPKTSSTEAKLRPIPASTAMSNMVYITGGLSVIYENKISCYLKFMLSITKEDSKISHFIPPTDVIIQQILYFSINLVNLIEIVPVGLNLT